MSPQQKWERPWASRSCTASLFPAPLPACPKGYSLRQGLGVTKPCRGKPHIILVHKSTQCVKNYNPIFYQGLPGALTPPISSRGQCDCTHSDYSPLTVAVRGRFVSGNHFSWLSHPLLQDPVRMAKCWLQKCFWKTEYKWRNQTDFSQEWEKKVGMRKKVSHWTPLIREAHSLGLTFESPCLVSSAEKLKTFSLRSSDNKHLGKIRPNI